MSISEFASVKVAFGSVDLARLAAGPPGHSCGEFKATARSNDPASNGSAAASARTYVPSGSASTASRIAVGEASTPTTRWPPADRSRASRPSPQPR